jgi:hypothetical protein
VKRELRTRAGCSGRRRRRADLRGQLRLTIGRDGMRSGGAEAARGYQWPLASRANGGGTWLTALMPMASVEYTSAEAQTGGWGRGVRRIGPDGRALSMSVGSGLDTFHGGELRSILPMAALLGHHVCGPRAARREIRIHCEPPLQRWGAVVVGGRSRRADCRAPRRADCGSTLKTRRRATASGRPDRKCFASSSWLSGRLDGFTASYVLPM